MTGEFADYQASALLMATYLKGMTLNETVELTRAMVESGEKYDLSSISGKKIDKHSTGGVGDKVSLILAPLAAACGLKVPMMSGRGLGHTGGTLDKLETIKGFNTQLSRSEFDSVLKEVGTAMIGQSKTIAPADRKLYALRDVTGTVECIPLICASILSKKIAEGANGLVLDVKVGSGAFMKTKDQARKLAKTLVQVGKKLGLPIRAVLSDMNQPLGYAVGNAIEVIECFEILSGKHLLPWEGDFCSSDLRELTIQLTAHMLEVAKISHSTADARRLAQKKLDDGSAKEIFLKMVKAQGGDDSIFRLSEEKIAPALLNKYHLKHFTISAKKKGFVSKMQTQDIGECLIRLGGGRMKVSDQVNGGVGLLFHKKLGSQVKPGESLVTIIYDAKTCTPTCLKEIESNLSHAIELSTSRKPTPKLVIEVLK